MKSGLTEAQIYFLSVLNADPTWRSIVDDHIKPLMPELPSYTTDPITGQDNSAEWRSASLIRDGFNTCLILLGVNDD